MWDRIKRWRWAILIALLLLLGLAYAFWPTATPVDTARVTRGPMAVGVTDDGVTRAEEYYVVSAPVTGYLSRIELEPGDRVTRGTLITTMTGRPSSPIDPRSTQELRGALASTQAAASGVQASLMQARRDLARAEELAGRGFLARADLEDARTRVATGEAALAQSRAEAARIRALLDQPQGPGRGAPVPVRAPASGAVLSVITESEGVIVGFEGPAAQQAARLGHGYQIDATVLLWSSQNALRVPIGALFRGPDGDWRVFVNDDGRARQRTVRLGHLSDEFAEVLGGLAEGDEVIVNPSNALEEGAKVRPR